MPRLPLRLIIPISAAVSALLVVALSYQSTISLLREEVTQRLQQDIRNRINQAQGSLERFLKVDYGDGVRQLVASFGSELDVEAVLVTDAEGKVIATTRHRLLNRLLRETGLPLDLERAQQVIRHRTSHVSLSGDRQWVQGYASICELGSSRSLRPKHCGLLYYQASLTYHLEAANRSVRDQALRTSGGIFALLLLLMALVHFRITRRIGLIQRGLQAFGNGERDTLIAISNNDELGEIGHCINKMLSRLRDDEAALLESQQQKLAIIDSANFCIISTDVNGVITSLNAVAERLLGYREEDLLDQHSLTLFHDPVELEAQASRLSRELGRPIAAGFEVFVARIRQEMGVEEQEWTYVRKDSGRFPVKLTVSCLTDNRGEVHGYLGIARDISEEKATAERLLLADKVFQSAGEAIVVTDPSGQVVDVNPAYEAITGYRKEEILGRSPGHIKSGHHDQAFYSQMWQQLTDTGRWEGEIWDRRKGGEIFPKWLSISAIKDSSGAVSHYVGIFVDISQQKATEEKLEQLAFFDPLTRLPNRALFRNRLDHELHMVRRNGTRLSLMFIDLDRFKYVNDTLGHDAGDELLIEVARRIQDCLRKSDTVARLGGDEFTLILPDLQSDEDAARVANSLIESLQQPFLIRDNEVYIGASIGIGIHPQDGEDSETLIKNADTAMYHAKELGRGNAQFFRAEMNQRNQRRLELEQQLRTALNEQQFLLHYQPKYELQGTAMTGMEALLRWQHPEQGMIPPSEFIPIAEEMGLILPLGHWVLQHACRQVRQWQRDGLIVPPVAVNLSARQFQDPDLLAHIASALEETGLTAEFLELEITETTVMSDPDRVAALLQQIRALGVSLSVDDFGTGYSSLAYLKKFPINLLKIDKAFIDDLETGSEASAIVDAIITLAHSLGLAVLAEGVESREQEQFLRQRGCDQAQGYLYSRPLAAEPMAELLAKRPQHALDFEE